MFICMYVPMLCVYVGVLYAFVLVNVCLRCVCLCVCVSSVGPWQSLLARVEVKWPTPSSVPLFVHTNVTLTQHQTSLTISSSFHCGLCYRFVKIKKHPTQDWVEFTFKSLIYLWRYSLLVTSFTEISSELCDFRLKISLSDVLLVHTCDFCLKSFKLEHFFLIFYCIYI